MNLKCVQCVVEGFDEPIVIFVCEYCDESWKGDRCLQIHPDGFSCMRPDGHK